MVPSETQNADSTVVNAFETMSVFASVHEDHLLTLHN
jgi:hypothetical protein